jgi:formylglycine-generating enzyme required for sulfatase activity/tRNA A-37 threonylcarbamoyl transferase component Bud32
MTVASGAGFVEALRSLPLLTSTQQAQLAGLQQQFPDVKGLAQELIRRGWLTVHQAAQLARCKGGELVLDRYVLLDLLGEGGMGAVYRARQTHLERIVALKLIRPEALKASGAVERFRREALLAAKLAHPNMVAVFDSGAAGDAHFLVMEYLEGTDLARLVQEQGSLPVGEACDYVRQAALGLQHAFEQGLVHRDIKPANLMVTRAGVVKVMDLGLARVVSSTDAAATKGLTGSGAVMGTADYLAPEQALNARQADVRADIYSLGCTLYRLLAGRVPFPGETFTEKLLAHQMQEPEPVERVRLGLPPGLAEVVRTMMAKKPEQRYQTPVAVAQALEPFASGAGPASVGRPIPAVPDAAPAEATLPVGSAVREPKGGKAAPLRERARAVSWPRGVRLALVGCLGVLLVAGVLLGLVELSAVLSGLAVGTDSRASSARPALLDCTGAEGTSAAGVRSAQAAWAKYLGRQVEEVEELAPGVTITFVLVPPGKFLMGSPKEEPGRQPEEEQHEVTLTEPFYLGKCEVTQAQHAAVPVEGQNPDPSAFKGADLPVEMVSWKEAFAYAEALTKKRANGLLYRLPTEAEWEYACRGGRPSSQPFGIGDGTSLSTDQANFNRTLQKTSRVGSYAANAFGLQDMHGNVWEWCADCYGPYPAGPATDPHGPAGDAGSSRVYRGGGWIYDAGTCRAAYRDGIAPWARSAALGFRLARSSPSGVK